MQITIILKMQDADAQTDNLKYAVNISRNTLTKKYRDMRLNNIPNALRELYMKLVSGATSVSNNSFIEAMETDYPQLKTCRKSKESEVYLECLKTALKQVNPKYDTNQGYIYFTPSRGGRIHTKEVYDWFEKLCEKYTTDD